VGLRTNGAYCQITAAICTKFSKKFGITAVKTAVIRLEGMKEVPKEVFCYSNKLFCGSAFNK